MVFLQSYVIMAGGCLPETQNKRIYQISGPKSGCGRLQESFWNSADWETKGLFVKWLLTRGGRLREVVAMQRELTVL